MKYAKDAVVYRPAGGISAATFVHAARFVTLLLVGTLTIDIAALDASGGRNTWDPLAGCGKTAWFVNSAPRRA